MPPRKAAQADPPHTRGLRSSTKRAHDHDNGAEDELTSTPAKRRRGSASQEARSVEPEPEVVTEETMDEQVRPSPDTAAMASVVTPRKRGRPPKASTQASTPRSTRAKATPAFATPRKAVVDDAGAPTPTRKAADRSARKKSARALIEQVVRSGAGDDDAHDDGDHALVRGIYEDSDDADDDDHGDDDEDIDGQGLDSVAATPSKTPRARRRKAKSPTPPRDLPPHELYFVDNKPGRPKTSDKTLGSLALMTHEEYFAVLREHQDRHAADVEYLEALHAESFPQWTFELVQGFSLCLYGFGSKRALLRKFAKHLHSRAPGASPRKTVMVNGYSHSASMREILGCIGAAVDATQRIPASTPPAMVHNITTLLSSTDLVLTVMVNSIDATPLRKPGMQAILAQLAAHPQVNLVCSADTPDFPLLWDVGVRSAFNFAFHDCTTFAPLTVELDVVDDVHELLGRKARRVNGREGVAFVLRSLPENAKNLFRLLVSEVLVAMEEEGSAAGRESAGVEYRMVYNKAVEEFICTSEMAFRTLLKECVDSLVSLFPHPI